MRGILLFLFFGVALSSCDEKRDLKKLQQTLDQTRFDTSIIGSLPLYDSLKNIVIANIDTIFKFRNSRNFVFRSNEKGDTSTVQEDEPFYIFYYKFGGASAYGDETVPDNQGLFVEVNDKNIPAYIYPSLDSMFKKLGEKRIHSFMLWTDSAMEIPVGGSSRDRIDVRHKLTWNRIMLKNDDPELFVKDTLIAPNWTYNIVVDNK